MARANEYKAAGERGWREQALPLHKKLLEMGIRIGAYLDHVNVVTLASTYNGLSRVVEASVNYAYQEWVERKADYPLALHNTGVLLYGEMALMKQQAPKPIKVYLKTETVAKIGVIGDFLSVTQYHTPYLFSTGHKGVYNRKLIIILCLNALSHALDNQPFPK